MKIGLIDVDGHAKKKKWGATIYPNIALAKLARYHRERGDDVEWCNPFFHYDIVYMAKVFNFSDDEITCIDADKIVKGGTGYDISSKLPEEIDRLQPEYSIYPLVPKDTAYGFLIRGCTNNCPWCVVPRKEGMLIPYMNIDELAIEGRRKFVLMDNNFLAAGAYALTQLEIIIERGYRVDFNQALDARLVDDTFAKLLARVKWLDNRRIRFGCDTPQQIEECERAMSLIDGYGFKGQYFLYTMLTEDMEESYERIIHWWKRLQKACQTKSGNMVYAYAQPYRDPDNKNHVVPQWQKDMARWVNKKNLFSTINFENYQPRNGFYCGQYFE